VTFSFEYPCFHEFMDIFAIPNSHCCYPIFIVFLFLVFELFLYTFFVFVLLYCCLCYCAVVMFDSCAVEPAL